MERRRARRWVPPLVVWCSLGAAAVLLAACGSTSGPVATSDTTLHSAGARVEADMADYLAAVPRCAAQSAPVVCVETADRTLGGQVHTYANVLAVGHGFSAPAAQLAATRNDAQTLANSLEILGDAEPTQANYDQVRNTFDVNAAIATLQKAVAKVDGGAGG